MKNYYQTLIVDSTTQESFKYGPKFTTFEATSRFISLLIKEKKFPLVEGKTCKIGIYDINTRLEVGVYSDIGGSWSLVSVSSSDDILGALMEEAFEELGHEFDLEAEAVAIQRAKLKQAESSSEISDEDILNLKRKFLR